MKLCQDCRWILPSNSGDPDGAKCSHPDAVYQTTSHVTGSVSEHRWTCETSRMHGMKCGPDGDLWAPKDGAVGFV